MTVVATDRELTVAELAKKTYLRYEQRNELTLSTSQVRQLIDRPELQGDADPEVLEKQYQREMRLLDTGTPPRYDSIGMNKVRRMEAHLREKFTHALPTFTHMERGRPTDIDFHVAWEREHQQDVLAWKTCLLILDPDNAEPNFLSIARLRSDTVKGDPRKYAHGYDNLSWTSSIEENLIRDLDDTAYMQFLEYKLLDWPKPLICRELAWVPAMYEAAMERLRSSRTTEAPSAETADSVDTLSGWSSAVLTSLGVEANGDTPPGWPRAVLTALGVNHRQFCQAAQLVQPYFYKYAKSGEWPAEVKARVIHTLHELSVKQSLEPGMSEPGDEESTESASMVED